MAWIYTKIVFQQSLQLHILYPISYHACSIPAEGWVIPVLEFLGLEQLREPWSEKSHTCDEGGAHPGISCWYLLMKKLLEISSTYTCVPKIPEIHSQAEFFVILGHFSLLPHPLPPSFPQNNPKNKNFEKMKKASRDDMILNLCNKKHNHMMYACSNMECDRHSFLSL